MRLTPLISATLAIAVASPLFAQEWIEFASREDRFTCNFPTQPKVTETTYRSQHEADLPARIYSASQGQSRYLVTVIDYTQAQRILTEKAKSCPAGAEPCLGGPGDEGHWKADIRGAIDYASWQLMQRDAKLTLFVWGVVDMVEGRQIQLTNNNEDTFMDIEGVVKEVHLVVPHSWIYMEVKDAKGETQMWALEATGRMGLQRIGVTADYVKPGDSVKARCHHLRDGSNGCLLGFLKAKDGTVKDWDGNNAPAPADF